jgi:hypothetical protein
MSKMIQVRNVPDDLHRRLKSRAALAGRSLSDYLLDELRRLAERPTVDEVFDRLNRLEPLTVREPPADVVRRERDRR